MVRHQVSLVYWPFTNINSKAMQTTPERMIWILLVDINNIQIWKFKMTTENLQESSPGSASLSF